MSKLTERERYQRYLCSPEWWRIRNAVMERAGERCEKCRRNPAIHVHHLTYIRKYNEHLDDLQALCGLCHNGIHRPPDVKPLVKTQATGIYALTPFERELFELMFAVPQIVDLALDAISDRFIETPDAKRLWGKFLTGQQHTDVLADAITERAMQKLKFTRESAKDRLTSLRDVVREKTTRESIVGKVESVSNAKLTEEEQIGVLCEVIETARRRRANNEGKHA